MKVATNKEGKTAGDNICSLIKCVFILTLALLFLLYVEMIYEVAEEQDATMHKLLALDELCAEEREASKLELKDIRNTVTGKLLDVVEEKEQLQLDNDALRREIHQLRTANLIDDAKSLDACPLPESWWNDSHHQHHHRRPNRKPTVAKIGHPTSKRPSPPSQPQIHH